MLKKRILRIVDANFNRLKEALRVVEDIFRFIYEDDKLRKKTRELRHVLDVLLAEKIFNEAILERNSIGDLGKKVDVLELNKKDLSDILFANLQRAKESSRVLEEILKITFSAKVSVLKKVRYDIYDLEKEAYKYKRR
ncbi:MAG: thiamine-phosphate pyrophosphorylase [Candidatus Omnitrophota bacterium]